MALSTATSSASNSSSSHFSQILADAQSAPGYLSQNSTSLTTFPLSILSTQTESADLWSTYEKLLTACLSTGDLKSASLLLERLTSRFGPANQRILALKGLYAESTASSDTELLKVLADYEATLADDPTNVHVAKRRVVLLRSLGTVETSLKALCEILEWNPTDVEAWCQAADAYVEVGLLERAVFCLEEALLIVPNAWNVHARLGEVLYISALADGGKDTAEASELLQSSVQRFCRSVELCDDYLRGYYGLKLATGALYQKTSVQPKISAKTVKDLNDKANEVLTRLVKQKDGSGYSESELSAAKRLLESTA